MEAAFRALRHSLPSDKAFGGRSLEKEYHKVMERSKTTLSNALCISLCADGWTNRRGEGIVNIVAGTPEPIFLKSVEPGPKMEDAEFLFSAFVEVIDEIGEHKVLLTNTDNAKVIQACWRLIQQRYSHIYAVGCGSHCLDLLFKDILKAAFFRDLFADVKTLIKIRKKRKAALCSFQN